jgi:hypothetical protein
MFHICVYMDGLWPLTERISDFRRAVRERDIPLAELPLGPHMTSKKRLEVQEIFLPTLAEGLEQRVRARCPSRGISSLLLPPAEFDLDDGPETVLHLPLEGEDLRHVISEVLGYFAEAGQSPAGYEGVTPHITLIERLAPEHRKTALEIARSIPWPDTATLGTVVIMHKKNNEWKPYHRIPLSRT